MSVYVVDQIVQFILPLLKGIESLFSSEPFVIPWTGHLINPAKVRYSMFWTLCLNLRIQLLNHFLLASPLSSSMDFFNRNTSASLFSSSRLSNSIWYSNCSSRVNSFRRSYFASGFPGFFWFSKALSPPDKYCRFHLRIFPSLIPVSLWSFTGDSPDRYRFTISSFLPCCGMYIPFASFHRLFLNYTTKDRRHAFLCLLSLYHFTNCARFSSVLFLYGSSPQEITHSRLEYMP